MKVQYFFHRATGTLTYLVSDSGEAVIIDPVLDYSEGKIATTSLQQVINAVKEQGLALKYILETHIHADHLSAGLAVKDALSGKTAISRKITDVYDTWSSKVNCQPLTQFDVLLDDGDELSLGGEKVSVLSTPGHTPADLTYHIGDSIFVGDTLFAPQRGTGRADFQGEALKTCIGLFLVSLSCLKIRMCICVMTTPLKMKSLNFAHRSRHRRVTT